MSATVLYMSMSLDGFIAGPNEGPENGLGDRGHRLHEWAMTADGVDLGPTRRAGGANGKVVDEVLSTGAIVAGRGPSSPPPAGAATTTTACRSSSWPATSPASTYRSGLVAYVNDVTNAMSQAEAAAGDKNMLVHGAGTAQRACRRRPR